MSSSRIRSAETIASRSAWAVIAATTSSATSKPSWAAKRAARIIRSGSSMNESCAVPGVRMMPAARSAWPSNRSTKARSGSRMAIALMVKSRRTRSLLEGVAEVDLRLAGLRVVLLGPVGGDLHLTTGDPGADRAEPDAHVPGRLGEAVQQREHRLGSRIGREVEVGVRRGGQAAEERVAHGPADQGQLVPGRREQLPDARQQAGERSQFDHGTPLGVGHARGGIGGHISRA